MRRLIICIMLSVVAALTLSAQQNVVLDRDMDNFSTISIGEKFTFKIKHAPTYSVRIISDERIIDYVHPKVRNGIFTISLDEKKYPSELKKELKSQDMTPFLEIEIYAPTVKILEIQGKAHLVETDKINAENFNLNVSGGAKVSDLYLDCVAADLYFQGNSTSCVSIDADDKVSMCMENSSVANIVQHNGKAVVEIQGSSNLVLEVDLVDLEVKSSGSADAIISGVASMIEVEAAANSVIDAETLDVKEGNFVQTGSSECHVNVAERMSVNLIGGSTMTYKRKPVIEVERIINSTLIKYDDPKRKK